MKNLIKIILIIGTLGLICFGVVSCTSNMDIDFSGLKDFNLGELFKGWGSDSGSGSGFWWNGNHRNVCQFSKNFNWR